MSCPTCRLVFRQVSYNCCPKDGTPLRRSIDPLVGTVLDERYVMEACIGEGGMGRVYRAYHQRVGRRFAIKVLFGDLAANALVVSRFAREAAAAGRLQHPNVVPVIDFGEVEGGLLYLVMDYVDGRTLRDVIESEHPLDRHRIIHLMIQLCQGLAHAHGRGLIHRDFKTDNILVGLDDQGEVARIADFGVARLMEGDSGDVTARLTSQGMVLGTPAYMAPEQAAGETIDHRADLFSLGLVLYEMLAGILPFDGSPVAIMRANMMGSPPPIAVRAPGVVPDPDLESLAHWLMAKSFEDRPADALVVCRRLEAMRARPWHNSEMEPTSPIAISDIGVINVADTIPMRSLSSPMPGLARPEPRPAQLASRGRPGFESSRPYNSGKAPASHAISDGSRALDSGLWADPAQSANVADVYLPDSAEAAVAGGAERGAGLTTVKARPEDARTRRGLMIAIVAAVGICVGVILFFAMQGKSSREPAATSAQAGALAAAADAGNAPDQEPSVTVEPLGTGDGDEGARKSSGADADGSIQEEAPATEPTSANGLPSTTEPERAGAAERPSSSASRSKSSTRKPRAEAKPGEPTNKPQEEPEKLRAPKEPVSTAELSKRYRDVGQALEELHKQRGEAAAAPLRQRYFAIRYVDALRDPLLRATADEDLRRLSKEIKKALGN